MTVQSRPNAKGVGCELDPPFADHCDRVKVPPMKLVAALATDQADSRDWSTERSDQLQSITSNVPTKSSRR